MNTERKRTRGKRGGAARSGNSFLASRGKDDRPGALRSGKPVVPNTGGSSAAALVIGAAIFYDCAEVEEQAETHIVPRESLTSRYMLPLMPQVVELESIPLKQSDGKGNTRIVEHKRIAWRSDKNLLRRNKPESELPVVKREGSVSEGLNTRKYIRTEREQELTDTVIGPALDVEL